MSGLQTAGSTHARVLETGERVDLRAAQAGANAGAAVDVLALTQHRNRLLAAARADRRDGDPAASLVALHRDMVVLGVGPFLGGLQGPSAVTHPVPYARGRPAVRRRAGAGAIRLVAGDVDAGAVGLARGAAAGIVEHPAVFAARPALWRGDELQSDLVGAHQQVGAAGVGVVEEPAAFDAVP